MTSLHGHQSQARQSQAKQPPAKQPHVKQIIQNAIATIEFFHPMHNSLPADILQKLADCIVRAGADESIRVIVLRSGGERTFCAGASFAELVKIGDSGDEIRGRRFFSGFADVINAMRKCPKLIVGRVQGKAVGGGVGLAAAADYCIASKHAAIKLSELHIGIAPSVIGPAVERKMGLSAMSQLTMDADSFYPAEWARQKGLYAQVLDSIEELDDAVQVLTKKLTDYNPQSMRAIKQIFWQDAEHWDELLAERATLSGRLALSDFTKSALRKFK